MKDSKQQRRETGVSFQPELSGGSEPMVLVEVERTFQLLTLDELKAVDENLHAAYRIAAFASGRMRPAEEVAS